MRVYVPATLEFLKVLAAEGEFSPVSRTAFAVTPTLREAYSSGDDEELSEVAMGEAARASLRLIADTVAFWAEWSGRCKGPTCSEPEWPRHWTDAVHRSLITLKALTYAPTGGIVAAATTSLPEWPGGPRNWDYRLCWLRDSTLTLFALMNAGYTDEAAAWRDWLIRAIAGSSDQVQIMYGLAGERRARLQVARAGPLVRGRCHRGRVDRCGSIPTCLTSGTWPSSRPPRPPITPTGWHWSRPVGAA